jgi:hypothetical protein
MAVNLMLISLRLLIAAVLLAAASGLHAWSGPASPQPGAAPRLIVILVVDQLRTDYLERYGGNLTAGLRRLMRDGAWFTEAAYPYLNTVTCSGHATIGTGTFPYRHGMVLNAWLDREIGKLPFCTDDESVREISYNGLEPSLGNSAERLLAPSLGEQLKQRGGRNVALSVKPRSAIPLAGRKADAVVWFDARGGWSTSTAFSRAPVPFLKQFIDANPLSADYGKVWERTLPASAYQFEDDAAGEGTPAGWTRVFPHPLGEPTGTPDAVFYAQWQRSPFADEYLARMATAALDAVRLGRGEKADFLGVSFSALDSVGHAFGPRSHEVQDMLVRLDATLGRLLDHLDHQVGRENYVVAFSSDHGVAEIPDQVEQGGRLPGQRVRATLLAALTRVLGPGEHIVASAYTDIYLTSQARQKLKRDAKLRAAATDALLNLPGVAAVFTGDELASADARSSADPVKRAAALSYYPGRSGDLIIAPKENWVLSPDVTTHGTHHAYDQRVPLIVYGSQVQAGRYAQPATPADLVPTVAALAGLRIEKTHGRVLTEALQENSK